MTAQEYMDYCQNYNVSHIIDMGIRHDVHERLYSSYMYRAIETARLTTSREPEILEGAYEITFNGWGNKTDKKSFMCWEILARLQWLFNSSKQKEKRRDTFKRLEKIADFLEESNEDVFIVMHSFVMRILSFILKKRGFRGRLALRAKNGEVYTYTKEK